MLSSLICLAALLWTPAPTLPAGTNAEFQKIYSDIMKASSKEDFAEAERLSPLLPKSEIVVQWDDSKVPAYLKSEFADARDRALTQWNRFDPKFSFKLGSKPDIKFTFEPNIGEGKDGAEPPSSVLFFGVSPEDPRLEVVISLERGVPAIPTEATDVHNEVAYAVTQYLGLAKTPTYGAYATHTDGPSGILLRPSPKEMHLANVLLDITTFIRGATHRKEVLIWAPPKASVDKEFFDLGTVKQGDVKTFSFQVSNIAKGQLHVTMIPDCGCVVPPQVIPLENGQSKLVQVTVDSSDFVGPQHKGIMLYTNDPDMPVTELKVKLNIIPAYRVLIPDGENINMEFKEGKREVFLVLPEGSDVIPKDYRLDGVPASVTCEPWSGELADPDLNESAKPRKGYKFTVNIEPGVYIGRNNATLVITTQSRKFPVLRYGLTIQNGIAAMPEKLNLYQIPRGPKRVSFLVSRPNQDFEITKVESDNPYLKFTYTPIRGKWEYKVTVQYDGKSQDAMVRATIKVWTNDPKYTVISVPFSATQK